MQDVAVPVRGGQINVWHRPASGGVSTAVLVHGLSGNSRWWGSVIDHLPDELGVIALDVRGRAGSADAPPPYDLTTIAGDIEVSLDHLGLDRAVVVGYSMGGWVAALFGVDHPDRVERIVLVDGGLPIPRDPDTDAEDLIEAIVGPSLRRLGLDFDSEESYFELWKAHPAFEKHWDDAMRPALGHELAPHGDGFRVRANPKAIEVGAREIAVGAEANQAASRLNVPSHLIVVERGTMDQPGGMIPLQTAEDAATANPELTMQYLPGLNHYTLVLGKGAGPVASAIAAPG
jgi:pimeloyl-ACP methyl ester carboxylesterase